MLDYGTIDEILSSKDMTYIRNNSLNDDGTDTVAGVDWFQYKGRAATNLYISGNSWIGFGENAEHLRIVRRDTDLMTLKREEGTLWGVYRFLHIRWEGFSVHGNRIEATKMNWDCILFDTGDICVSFEVIPTNSSYLAESNLITGSGTIPFTPLTGKVISFKSHDESGMAFVYQDHAPIFLDPYNRRYLISDAKGELYTVEDEALVKLEETELTAEIFETYGVQDIPAGALLIMLQDPTILYWHDSENRFPPFRATYTGVPIPQVIFSENIDMSDSTILGIEKVTADCDDHVLFAVSFDDGKTWWSCIDSRWMKLSEEKSGMSNLEQQQVLVNLMSSGYIEPDIYHAERNELLQEADLLNREKQQLTQSISGDLTHLREAEKLQRFLARRTKIAEYDDELFLEYVENIMVQDRVTFTFNMKCGLSLTERVVLE